MFEQMLAELPRLRKWKAEGDTAEDQIEDDLEAEIERMEAEAGV